MNVHQMLPTLSVGDAIGNQVLTIRSLMREAGHGSEIFAEQWHPQMQGECHRYDEYARFSGTDNLLLLHYSIGGPSHDFALALPDQVVLVYHNITPAHFFRRTNPTLARQLREARNELRVLAHRWPAIAVSEFNRRELLSLGFRVLGVAPVSSGRDGWVADPNAPEAIQARRLFAEEGHRNWLHVGRLAPNKRIEDIIRAFYFYQVWIEPRSKLLLVGTGDGNETYVDGLYRLVSDLGLDGAVAFCGHWPDEGLAAFYRMADVYVCMSEHEGFCVPLVEAMRFSIPILAFASTGVPDTLGDSGVLVTQKDFAAIAEMAHELIVNEALRANVVKRQTARLAAFDPSIVRQQTMACIEAAMGRGLP